MNKKYKTLIDFDKLPNHIAIIMDGNGRWAKKRFLPHSAGHKAGAEGLRRLCEEANKMGLRYLTVYAFSTENHSRPSEEVSQLMNMMRQYIQQYIDDSEKNDIKLTIIGDRSGLDADLQESLRHVEEITAEKTGLNLVIALNYGGRDEITRAFKALYRSRKNFSEKDITQENITQFLDTSEIPDPDLLIRTSNEYRLSNFLLWQIAYAELVFVEKLWPDFNIDDLCDAIEKYQKRDRRFGGRK